MKSNMMDDLKERLLERELNRMLTVTEAAEILGVSNSTLRKFSNESKIQSYRIGSGRHRRFRKGDVLAFLENGTKGGADV